SLLVVTNALRLNRWRYPEAPETGEGTPAGEPEKTVQPAAPAEAEKTQDAEDAKTAEKPQEGESMKEIVITVKGMMCEHCEARVRKCLLEIPGVSDARVSRTEESAAVTADDTVTRESLIAAVKAQGYTAE
ncbi:MAG: heavy-metal-associated domain-containing protein, partial [Lachnospiraceae bacterium]|nr:heavy-metal-associated domain-containing protein [Lachnospiraceae bacterium]